MSEKITLTPKEAVKTLINNRPNHGIYLPVAVDMAILALENCYPQELSDGKAVFDFGTAIRYLKEGHHLTRKGWNGKNQYIMLATNLRYDTLDGTFGKAVHKDIGSHAIAFVGTSGVQIGWLASQADMLAEDWAIMTEVVKE